MKRTITLFVCQIFMLAALHAQYPYNKLPIPDTIAGYIDTSTGAMTYDLVMEEGLVQFLPGQQTHTAGFNGPIFGPTLIFRKGENIQINLISLLNETSTCHWHGIHLPGVMDGGPHQFIPPGTIWRPYWKVIDSASTFWYHPHLHMHTNEQVRSGLSGLIIVRDSQEAALPLPRTYGVDDIPLIVTDRGFDSNNQFDVTRFFGDTVIVNGALNPVDTLPDKVVRFRILNAAQERLYNLGFSDNTPFYVIGTDGGLVDVPVPVTRFLISPGERVQILVNMTGRNGDSLDLVAYNNALNRSQPGGIPVGDHGAPFFMWNNLGHRQFRLVHFNVDSAVHSPIISIPTTLKSNTYWNIADTNLSRTLLFRNWDLATNDTPFIIDSAAFDLNVTNKYVPLNNTETWTLTNHSLATHVFHIHDIQFYILSRTIDSPSVVYDSILAQEKGWKDVVRVDTNSSVTFITKFTDYADSLKPYMYHCHMLGHEDGGMMGQFAVVTTPSGIKKIMPAPETAATVYPNPAADRLFVDMQDKTVSVYYATIFDAVGRTKYMLPEPRLKDGIIIAALKPGIYYLVLIDSKGNKITKQFVKQ